MRKCKYKIGERYFTKNNLEFEIADTMIKEKKRKVRFIESGYETVATISNIKTGNIRDRSMPHVIGGGFVGFEISNPKSHPLYNRWWHMMNRCYNPKCDTYSVYGGDGCYVCEEWKCFTNYVRDIENKENYEKILSDPRNWDIDKDMIDPSNKCYCNEFTSIIPSVQNIKIRNNQSGNPHPTKIVHQFTIEGEYVKRHESCSSAIREIKKSNSSGGSSTIGKCCRGERKTAYGFKWVSNEDFVKYGKENIKDKILKGDR